jgi:hypothetical protein
MHPNLRGFWRMENTLLDASGNGNNGTVGAGSAAYADGKLGRAWDNDATRFVNCGSSATIAFDGNQTWCAWVKTTRTATEVIFGGGLLSGVSRGCGIYARSAGNFGFQVRNLSATSTAFSTTSQSVNIWQHLCGVRRGNTSEIWVNGILEGTNTTAIGGSIASSDPIRIGTNGAANFADFLSVMQIDEAQIYNAALDANDIRRVMMGQMPQRRYA